MELHQIANFSECINLLDGDAEKAVVYRAENTYTSSSYCYHLIYKANELYLNRNHKYFTQCQMQLGVTGLKKCYFMVWTCHGFIVDEICFDSALWEYLKQFKLNFNS